MNPFLSLTKYEIYQANKHLNVNHDIYLVNNDNQNNNLPYTAGIIISNSMLNFTLSSVDNEKHLNCGDSEIHWQEKFTCSSEYEKKVLQPLGQTKHLSKNFLQIRS